MTFKKGKKKALPLKLLQTSYITQIMSDRVLEINALAKELKANLKQFPNFPKEGILFEDFLPIFTKPDLFNKLIKAFKLHVGEQKSIMSLG